MKQPINEYPMRCIALGSSHKVSGFPWEALNYTTTTTATTTTATTAGIVVFAASPAPLEGVRFLLSVYRIIIVYRIVGDY